MEQTKVERHHLLPRTLEGHEISNYLAKNCVEDFKEQVKKYFDPEEIQDFEHESSKSGREINRLKAIIKAVTDHVNKGGDEELIIELPATAGVKSLESQRKQNDDFCETGYTEIEERVFGMVDVENEKIVFFLSDGTEVKDRERPMSNREKLQYCNNSAVFNMAVNE